MGSVFARTASRVAALIRTPATRYQPVSEDPEDRGIAGEDIKIRIHSGFKRVWGFAAVLVGIIVFVTWSLIWEFSHHDNKSCDSVVEGYQCTPNITHYWGQYSPYFSVPSEISAEVPEKCTITFAQVLARHGARDPTALKSGLYADLISHIHEKVNVYPSKYAFLKRFKYELGSDQLTAFGENQLENLGQQFYARYQDLTRQTVPFIRASGQERVIKSAEHFASGFHAARKFDKAASKQDRFPYPILSIPESSQSNNTLSHSLCDAFESGAFSHHGSDVQAEFASTFVPTIRLRLNKHLHRAKLTPEQVIYFMDMCPFHTASSPHGIMSPFCNLFTEAEWRSYDYYQSLGKYYGFAHGNPMGPSQGVGFANELIARLTNTAVDDHTSSNRTLDADPASFPLNGTKLFVDLSHDNDITSIFAALGLYNMTASLNKENIQSADEVEGYSAAWTVPFGARAFVEKMQCEGQSEELVRVLINDRVVPLKNCSADELGRCKLSSYVESFEFAKRGGEWDACWV